MKTPITAAAVLSLFCGLAQAAPVTIDFEGVVADDTAAFDVDPYVEDGMRIVSDRIEHGIFGKDYSASSIPAADNDNGSAIFGWCNQYAPGFIDCRGQRITLTSNQGHVFDLLSLDASNLDLGVQPQELLVRGFYGNGQRIDVYLDLQQDIWNTYAFTSDWTDLVSVSIWGTGENWDAAMDNIQVNVVPIPPAILLFASALAALMMRRRG